MTAIDPGQPDTWPPDIRIHVEHLLQGCRANPQNSRDTPSSELELGNIDAFMAEREFRNVLGERHIALYHATRLLPHEVTAVRQQGLLTLTEEHRHNRFDAVIEHYGSEIGPERLEALRGSGPLNQDETQRRARLGLVYGVTPLGDAIADAGGGMTVFLENWGGEAIYGAASSDEAFAETIGELTRRSLATIVELAAPAPWVNGYLCLWRVFVGQLDGRERACGEFRIRRNIPSQQILDLLHESSARWPRGIGPLISP